VRNVHYGFQSGGQLKLVEPDKKIQELLQITKLLTVFQV